MQAQGVRPQGANELFSAGGTLEEAGLPVFIHHLEGTTAPGRVREAAGHAQQDPARCWASLSASLAGRKGTPATVLPSVAELGEVLCLSDSCTPLPPCRNCSFAVETHVEFLTSLL